MGDAFFAMSIFGFGAPCSVDIEFADQESRKKVNVNQQDNSTAQLCLYYDNPGAFETVAGSIKLRMNPGKKVEHVGIRVELIGQIELFYDRGNHVEFTSMLKELAPPGTLTASEEFPFESTNVEKLHESYNGINVRLRYFMKFTIVRQYSSNITKEQEFWVQKTSIEPEINNSIKMEVGIEDCLHIEFEYNKSKYHLKDVVVGKIYFLLVRIKIKHMELAIIRRESTGSGPNLYNESETITKFEIMDGAPVRGEAIPIRLFLQPYALTPTYKSINNKFNVKYFLNLVLVDEEDRRYFKQQEIHLWRKELTSSDGVDESEENVDLTTRSK